MDELEQLKQRAAQAITAVYEKILVEADRENPRPDAQAIENRLGEVSDALATEHYRANQAARQKAIAWGWGLL